MYLQLVSINNSNTQKKPDAGKSTSGLFLLHQPLFGWLLPIDCGMVLGAALGTSTKERISRKKLTCYKPQT
jgi:hypothetical protein